MANLEKKNDLYESLSRREFDLLETLVVLRTPIDVYWSWGVEKLVNYYNKGLILLVNGFDHQGVVFIALAFNDTYSYYIIDGKTIKKEVHDVYFDQLQELIDKDIEYIEGYK
jgi:hypothetical protein